MSLKLGRLHEKHAVATWNLGTISATLVFIVFKNPVRTSKRTPHFTITKINWLMLFKEIIPFYNEKPRNTKSRVTDHWSRWGIYLPLGLKGLRQSVPRASLERPQYESGAVSLRHHEVCNVSYERSVETSYSRRNVSSVRTSVNTEWREQLCGSVHYHFTSQRQCWARN
jgi:hypothetical protein